MALPVPTRFPDTAGLDREIESAAGTAIILWRGEALPFAEVPERIGAISGRGERDLLYGAYREALEALNPLYRERLAAWTSAGDLASTAAAAGPDPRALATDVERFVLHGETPYYASLRRYLALIDIEQGDATIADLWHVARGTAWAHWFGDREVRSAVLAAGRQAVEIAGPGGWRDAETMLAGPATTDATTPADAVTAAYVTLAGSPEWLAEEVGIASSEVTPFADFAAFVRLWRLRHDIAMLQYELRLFAGAVDPALSRAYYSGILGHMIGVGVPEEAYLTEVPTPFASVGRLEVSLLAGQLIEVLEARHGTAWWREPAAGELAAAVASAPSTSDALAQLGYDDLDWRPVLRQIRTRLIGEMSGYGGPNITTRAGTRKV
ncbi:MAG TPA: hypothetical protein VF365_08820 [Candidatus Limnocylindria bacterium]